MNQDPQSTDFSGLGIAPILVETLEKLKIKTPTPIQQQAIPIAIQGKDVLGIAQTGTGKTLAFGLPVVQRLQQIKGQALILVPTRELAIQVEKALSQIGSNLGLRTAMIIGGMAIHSQIRAIAKNPQIIVSTPGRLIDHLDQRRIKLNEVKIVVMDEADRMLDMGFSPQIKKIFAVLPSDRQTMLFSATMPAEILKMATSYMKLPIRIEVALSGTTAERVTQEIFIIPRDSKIRLVEKLLEQYRGTTLIFTRTKHGTKKLTRDINDLGHRATELHSNRSLNQRRDSLDGFKSGKYRVLIATDIASRGIDVVGIELIINYDLPANAEDYVHRIGRTARAGSGGHAISLVSPDQRRELRDIEYIIRRTLPISKLPDLPPARPSKFSPSPTPINRTNRPNSDTMRSRVRLGSDNRPGGYGHPSKNDTRNARGPYRR